MAEVRADICKLQRDLRVFLQTVIGTSGTALQTVTGTVVNYIQSVNSFAFELLKPTLDLKVYGLYVIYNGSCNGL